MGRYELEFDDKGDLVGETPEPLKALIQRSEAAAHGQGYGKGVQKAAEDAKAQIEANVKAELAKREALAPLEKEKWARIDEENISLKGRLTEAMREADRTLKAREETHAREILQRSEALLGRDTRIKSLLLDQLEGLALAAGAREESLSELKVILGAYIGYTDDMDAFVKDEDGQPRLLHGKPMPIKVFVKDYLDTHSHHRKPPAGRGGGAQGGASFHGRTGVMSVDAAVKRIHEGDRTPTAINELFEATRKRAAG